MSKHCPHCGAEQKNQAIFCGHCGKSLPLGPALRADAESENREQIPSFSRVPDASTMQSYGSAVASDSSWSPNKIFVLLATLCILAMIFCTKPKLKVDTLLYLCETDNVASFKNTFKVREPFSSYEESDTSACFFSRFMGSACFITIHYNADFTFSSAEAWSHEPTVDTLVRYHQNKTIESFTEQLGEYELVDFTYTWPHPTSQLKDARIEFTWYANGGFKLEIILKDN